MSSFFDTLAQDDGCVHVHVQPDRQRARIRQLFRRLTGRQIQCAPRRQRNDLYASLRCTRAQPFNAADWARLTVEAEAEAFDTVQLSIMGDADDGFALFREAWDRTAPRLRAGCVIVTVGFDPQAPGQAMEVQEAPEALPQLHLADWFVSCFEGLRRLEVRNMDTRQHCVVLENAAWPAEVCASLPTILPLGRNPTMPGATRFELEWVDDPAGLPIAFVTNSSPEFRRRVTALSYTTDASVTQLARLLMLCPCVQRLTLHIAKNGQLIEDELAMEIRPHALTQLTIHAYGTDELRADITEQFIVPFLVRNAPVLSSVTTLAFPMTFVVGIDLALVFGAYPHLHHLGANGGLPVAVDVLVRLINESNITQLSGVEPSIVGRCERVVELGCSGTYDAFNAESVAICLERQLSLPFAPTLFK